jgi:tetratricopeptide (TPR) repeat protein
MQKDNQMSEFASSVDIATDTGTVQVDASQSLDAPAQCACGSGLRAADCCNLDLTNLKPAVPSPANLERLTALTEARAAADRPAATAVAIDILTEQPTLLEALSALFLIRRSEGVRSAAHALIERLTKLAPHESRFSTYLVDGYIEDKAWEKAEAAARKVVRLMPGDRRAHDTLGLVLSLQQKLPEGEFHQRRALELGERTPRLLGHLASNLQTQGRIDEARGLYEEAHALNPASLEIPAALGNLERVAGNVERAWTWLAEVESGTSSSPEVKRQKANLAFDRGDFHAVLDILESAFPNEAQRHHGDSYLAGQALDKLGRYDEAFAMFEQANLKQRNVSGNYFDSKAPQGMAQATRNFMTGQNLSFLPRAGLAAGVAQPLFIVGFGRSGTTMLEQSLSMHPKIIAAGELPGMARTAAVTARVLGSPLGYPFALSELWTGDQHYQISLLRDHYLNIARCFFPKEAKHDQVAWFTDKALSQEHYLGLIHLLFPQSPIIHLVRHPLDVVVSNYSNALPLGGYENGVGELAEYYLLLLETAEHLRKTIPSLKCMQVKYEDILEDQVHWTRAILDFAGEPFDAACLDFHENKRHARTISHQQVREKINNKSKYRYKNYLPHLGPAIDVLGPAIERLGYSI